MIDKMLHIVYKYAILNYRRDKLFQTLIKSRCPQTAGFFVHINQCIRRSKKISLLMLHVVLKCDIIESKLYVRWILY